MSAGFYSRSMAVRIAGIFGNPQPPAQVTEDQFDAAQDELVKTAAKPWHEIDQSDYWHYLLDLCYVDLQQDLFDYLFPAFLIRWWEGQLSRYGGPESECDFYRALDHGQVLFTMMNETRRTQVLDWMTDAYMDGVDAWSGNLSVANDTGGPDDLHGPLWSFHALGQSVPITGAILERLADVSTLGRAQWWLVFATGIVWNANSCPAVPEWTPTSGGGGVYIIESAASIFDHGYLPENLEALTAFLDYPKLVALLEQSYRLLPSFPHGDWALKALEEAYSQSDRITARLARLYYFLNQPDLGGVLMDSLDAVD